MKETSNAVPLTASQRVCDNSVSLTDTLSVSDKNIHIRTINLTKFNELIQYYWDSFDEAVHNYKDIMYGITNKTYTKDMIQTIYALKQLDTWKSNLFILYLHYKKPNILAELLNVKKNTLSVYLSEIKREIKNNIYEYTTSNDIDTGNSSDCN